MKKIYICKGKNQFSPEIINFNQKFVFVAFTKRDLLKTMIQINHVSSIFS